MYSVWLPSAQTSDSPESKSPTFDSKVEKQSEQHLSSQTLQLPCRHSLDLILVSCISSASPHLILPSSSSSFPHRIALLMSLCHSLSLHSPPILFALIPLQAALCHLSSHTEHTLSSDEPHADIILHVLVEQMFLSWTGIVPLDGLSFTATCCLQLQHFVHKMAEIALNPTVPSTLNKLEPKFKPCGLFLGPGLSLLEHPAWMTPTVSRRLISGCFYNIFYF